MCHGGMRGEDLLDSIQICWTMTFRRFPARVSICRWEGREWEHLILSLSLCLLAPLWLISVSSIQLSPFLPPSLPPFLFTHSVETLLQEQGRTS